MNISKDGKTLYFSDEEINNDTNGEKKVYVTKRINGKESHVKAIKDTTTKLQPKEEKSTFNFNQEIVIGVNVKEENNKKEKIKKKTNKNNHKKRKKRKINKKIIAIFGSILLITSVIIIALTTPIFNIEQIQIQGNSKISADTILSLSGLKKGENIFKFNDSVIQNIKENTYIENVEITRKLPGTVIILVEEREIKYQISFINSYSYLDKNGYILENSTVKQNVPILTRIINNRRRNIK